MTGRQHLLYKRPAEEDFASSKMTLDIHRKTLITNKAGMYFLTIELVKERLLRFNNRQLMAITRQVKIDNYFGHFIYRNDTGDTKEAICKVMDETSIQRFNYIIDTNICKTHEDAEKDQYEEWLDLYANSPDDIKYETDDPVEDNREVKAENPEEEIEMELYKEWIDSFIDSPDETPNPNESKQVIVKTINTNPAETRTFAFIDLVTLLEQQPFGILLDKVVNGFNFITERTFAFVDLKGFWRNK